MNTDWEMPDLDKFYPQGITAMKFIGGEWVEVDVTKEIKSLISQSTQKAASEAYKSGMNDLFLKIAGLAEPDERQPGAGELHTNLDDIYKIVASLTLLTKD